MPFCSTSFSRGRTSWCESEASRALGQYDGITVVSQGTRTAVAGGDCARAQPPVHGGAAEAGEFPKRENRYKHTQVYQFLASQPSSGCPIHTEPAGGYTASATGAAAGGPALQGGWKTHSVSPGSNGSHSPIKRKMKSYRCCELLRYCGAKKWCRLCGGGVVTLNPFTAPRSPTL